MKKNSSFRFVVLLAVVALSVVPLLAQDATNAPAAPAVASAPVAPTAPSDGFFFQDGDTPAVFLGDSITEQKLYTTLIETYVLTRFPAMKITFRNAGWSGDTAWLSKRGDFDTGLKRDVLDLKPKAVTINFGMNDARGGDGTFSKYLEYTTKLVKGLEKAGARVVLISPSPEERYEANAPAGSPYNVMLKKYADGMKEVSENEKVLYIDQYTPFVAYIEAGRKAGVLDAMAVPGDANAVRLTNDGIHPNWGGHLIMATIILQAMHAPADVSSVSVDAMGHSIISSQGCTVEWINGPDGQVQFKRTDEALPWPLPTDPRIDTVLKIPGFDPITALDRYGLKVSELKEVAYTLSIDNVNVGVFSRRRPGERGQFGHGARGPTLRSGAGIA